MTSESVKKTRKVGYEKYRLSRSSINKIDTIELDDPKVTKSWFFDNYIKMRKPVVIKYNKSNSDKFHLDVDDFKPDKILDTLKNDDHEIDTTYLQVEELNKGGFGSGQKRLKMTFEKFLNRINDGELLYHTTQYTENDPDEGLECSADIRHDTEDNYGDDDDDDDDGGEEDGRDTTEKLVFPSFDADQSDNESFILDPENIHDDFDEDFDEDFGQDEVDFSDHDVDPIYQPPLSNLLDGGLHKLPPHTIELTEPLVPQQINLWIGRTPSETEQLKIQYDDNGDKVESINKGLPKKNSTSTGLHHDHADNLYVLIQGKKRFTLFSPDFAPNLYTTGDIRCIYETGVIDYICNEKAKDWQSVRADGGCLETDDGIAEKLRNKGEKEEIKQDPPSFCRIPPSLLHLDETDDDIKHKLETFAVEKYPMFASIKDSSAQVLLEDGDLLYLPAGWFHEVTSYGDEQKDNIHVALNYWFVPPDGAKLDQPYSDSIWEEEYKIWKKKYLQK